jgi:hypothetical protein
MIWNWEAIGAICTIAVAFGGMLMVWWKFSKETSELHKTVEEHKEKIAILIVEKASVADMMKLSTLLETIQHTMMAHHLDATIHRNKDFENRMDALGANLTLLARENKEDHDYIKRLIVKDAK